LQSRKKIMGRKNLSVIRKKEIIISFYEVAKKIGLENTSFAKIAGEMNISKSLIIHYFQSRESLLIGLNEYMLEQHLHIVSDENLIIDSKESIEKLIYSLFSRSWNSYFDDGVFYSCYALIYRMKEFNESFKKYLEELHIILEKQLIEAKENNLIENDNIKEITEIMYALIDGAYYYLGLFDENDENYKNKVLLYQKYALNLLQFN
jgi:AcrR family transcriptional regulator